MTKATTSRRAKTGTAAAGPNTWAPLPATLTGATAVTTSAAPPAPGADEARVHLGGQAPMFIADAIADAGLVRLGGQSPTF